MLFMQIKISMIDYNFCSFCKAPDTLCPYWMGTFCEYEDAYYEEFKYIIDYLNSFKEDNK